MNYGEVLEDKGTLYIMVTIYTEGTGLYCDCLVWCVCTVVVVTGFVMCGCMYVWGL